MSLSALLSANFKTSPFKHQLKEFEEGCEARHRILAWTMRTGKSKATIDRACHLYLQGEIDAVVIFSPNGVHENWIEKELPAHGWDGIDFDTFIWRTSYASDLAYKRVGIFDRDDWKENNAQLMTTLALVKINPSFLWASFNSESLNRPDVQKAIKRIIGSRRVLLAIDESDDFGLNSGRTQFAVKCGARVPYSMLMSGTMLTASPLAAYWQTSILKKNLLGFSKFDGPDGFKMRYGVWQKKRMGKRRFMQLVGFQNLPELRRKLAPYTSVVLRDECDDMPKLNFSRIDIEPTPEQRAIYEDLRESFLTTINDEDVSLNEKAAKIGKLQQVFSGFLIDEFDDLHRIPGGNPRLAALAKEIRQSPGKVIVWAHFQFDIDTVKNFLIEAKIPFVEYHGRSHRADALPTFQNDPKCKVLLGHVQAGGRGRDMSSATCDKIITYSHTFKSRLRVQSLERATKIGGRNIAIVDIAAPGPDRYILKKVQTGIELGDALAGTGLRKLLQEMKL